MSASGGGSDDIASRGPFSFLAGDYGDLVGLLEQVTDLLDGPSFVDASKEVIVMPPEERFTESIEVFKTVYGIDKSESLNSLEREDIEGDFASFIDEFSPSQFPALMNLMGGQLENTRDKALDRVIIDRRRSEDYLVAVVFVQRLLDAAQNTEDAYYQEDNSIERISPFVVLFARLILIAADEQTEFTDEFFRDLVRAEYYISRSSGEEPDRHPDEMDLKEVIHSIRQEGALLVYDTCDISVGRGAELAKMTASQFEELLFTNGIVPRYGPEEGDELLGGPGLSKSR